MNVTISGPLAPLALYANITPSPSTFTQGQAASVNTNIINNDFSAYYGQYAAALYDLSGNYVETIGTLNENNGLPSGYVYNPPGLTFSTNAVGAAPGTYILAVLYYDSGTSTWYLCDGTSFTNPVNVIVVAPAIVGDVYEDNDTESTAYTFTLSWSGNSATKETTGSNNHVGTDLDFYKINLASGYNYTITARAHDSYNSGNGNTYTNDVLWSYKTPGNNWSSVYDDVMQGNISMSNGGLLKFQVAPYFQGQTGTYLLEIDITRSAISGVEELSSTSSFDIYPNPTNGNFTLATNFEKPLDAVVSITNVAGQTVKEFSLLQTSDNQHNLKLESAAGLYFVNLKTDEGIVTRKLVVE